ncbi:MAG: cobalt ECF transporter T component CbiQ [Spirochaetaceae bacterium]|jgi:cobalt/nickel transport system permease protein|nr:cobalt ECF transporter T component CbiQ [Spirochaetaceae bacterium]
MITIDKLSYSNKMLQNHPLEKVLLSICSLIAVLFSNTYILPGVVLFSMIMLIVVKADISWKLLMNFFLIPLVFICTSLIPLLFTFDITGTDGYFLFYELGFHKALFLFVKSLSSISCFYFLILTTPLEQLDYLMGKLKISILFREIMVLIYRFIFLLTEMVNQIYISQKQRIGYVSFKGSMRSIALLSSSILSRSLNHCSQAHLAVKARGGDSNFIFIESEYDLKLTNLIYISLYFCLLVFVKIGEFLWPI